MMHCDGISEVRAHIVKHQLTSTPITTILIIDCDVRLKDESETREAGAIRNVVMAEMLSDLIATLNNPGRVSGVVVQLPFDFHGSTHLTSRTGHVDFVKSIFVKNKVRALNKQWRERIQDAAEAGPMTQVASATVKYLITRPADYPMYLND
jgi:hypothetical protein